MQDRIECIKEFFFEIFPVLIRKQDRKFIRNFGDLRQLGVEKALEHMIELFDEEKLLLKGNRNDYMIYTIHRKKIIIIYDSLLGIKR